MTSNIKWILGDTVDQIKKGDPNSGLVSNHDKIISIKSK